MKARSVLVAASALALAVGGHNVAHAAKRGGGSSKDSKADYRSAESGKYVKKDYAEKNKKTTVREERKKK
jgi:hypothetical protein